MINHREAQSLITQAVILVNQNYEILLLQLPDGRWQLPGGKLHTKEIWSDGVIREITEETGIKDIAIVRVLYIDNWHTTTYDYYRAYFLCTTMSREVYLSSDHRRYRWIQPDTNLDTLEFTHETVRIHLKRFLDELNAD
ncbi:MAG: 8-oxo-dGTP diphosphatase [Candidatus Dependentiae bacterium]|nr:8-oxo-dGTP diphosphatase [Candidatus Dependentiae bacterium]